VSQDGRYVAYSAGGGGIAVVPLDGSAAPRQLTDDPVDRNAAFSRDGAVVYFARRSPGKEPRILKVPATGGEPIEVLGEGAKMPAASSTADILVYISVTAQGLEQPMLLDLRSRRVELLSAALPATKYYKALHFSGDGTRVVVYDTRDVVTEIDLASRQLRRAFQSTEQLKGIAYLGSELIVERRLWSGGIWLGTDLLGARGVDE
jgi:hypothetical protein